MDKLYVVSNIWVLSDINFLVNKKESFSTKISVPKKGLKRLEKDEAYVTSKYQPLVRMGACLARQHMVLHIENYFIIIRS